MAHELLRRGWAGGIVAGTADAAAAAAASFLGNHLCFTVADGNDLGADHDLHLGAVESHARTGFGKAPAHGVWFVADEITLIGLQVLDGGDWLAVHIGD